MPITTDAIFQALDIHTYAHLVVGIVVAFGFAALPSFVPFLRGNRTVCLLSIAAAVACHQSAFLGFALVNAAAYFALSWLQSQTDRARRWRSACLIILLLAVIFTLGRLDHWERITWPGRASIALYAADMWLVLRLVTLFWEVGSGVVRMPSLGRFITWTCLPFTLIGPVFRYSQMPATLQVNRQFWVSGTWWREMAAGAGKLAVAFVLPVIQLSVATRFPHPHWISALFGALVTGPIAFYLMWAGYFNLMEVMGKPVACKLSMSFNFPIGRENISAFWANWNMTATAVFRDYLFYNRWGMKKYNVYFNSLLLFSLVGLWHEANAYWVLWGFFHGLLFSTYLLWRKFRNKLTALPLQGTPAARAASRVFTYVCVCACWYLPSKILLTLSPR